MVCRRLPPSPGIFGKVPGATVPRTLALSASHALSDRAGQDFGHLVASQSIWVRLHAAGPGSFLDQFGSVFGAKAVAVQAQGFEVGHQLAHPLDAGFSRRRRLAG